MKENEGFFIFLFIVLTWYMAAMYRIPSLMALSLAELFMVFLLFLSARYFRRNFQAGFCEKQEVVRKKGKISVRIWTENHAFLPLGRYRIQLFSSYEKFQKGRFFTYDGSIDSKKREEEELVLEAPWCGKLYVSMIYRQTYDYLSLFKTRAKSFCEEEIAVLPSGFPLTVRLSSSAAWENRGYEEDAAPQAGGSGGEIRQLREYVPGDLVRRIHWNQSARTDRLLVKEFQKEEEESVSLYLDFSGEEEPRAKEWGAFYQILSGLILGLLKEKAAVQVSWEDSRGQFSCQEVKNEQECMSLLLLLYDRDEMLFIKSASRGGQPDGFTLNLDREVYFKEGCAHKFSLENCEKELEETQIIIC